MEGPMGTLPPPPDGKAGSDRPAYDGRPRVAFQGELGAYSEMAVTQHYGEDNAVPVPCDDFDELVPNLPWLLTHSRQASWGRAVT